MTNDLINLKDSFLIDFLPKNHKLYRQPVDLKLIKF